MKVLIKETFGGNRTYLNQVFLCEDLSNSNSITIPNKSNNIVQNENRKSESENLMISNVSNNRNEEEFEEEMHNFIARQGDKKHSYIDHKDNIDQITTDNKFSKHVNGENSNLYANVNLNEYYIDHEDSQSDFRNCRSEVNYKRDNYKSTEFESK